ncbi:transmembrane protein 248-like [Stegodyphus dumicola]|uniref:transmembrane protein 248-like n=1 Tax=Stegodyphus dumicola TaxID=202533 RepID=UPI0015AE5C98|nr:transmembrane protein 248-like [Stegodyphus dumicola]
MNVSGKYSSLLFNISLSFQPLNNSSCDGAKCHSLYEACLIMSLPADLLPETKSPERCKAGDYIEQEAQPIYFSENQILSEKGASTVCIELDYTPDAKLTEMLSLQDRSIVNLHLMHTSYFMFVMVMTLVCYSLIKGRYRHPKNSLSLEKIPLDA